MSQKDSSLIIPFIKSVRIGNFKLWRGRYTMKNGKEKSDIECVHISNLDGSWMIRIPSTMSLFSTICNGYATVDEKMRDNFLGMIFTNIYNVGTISSEALHDAFFFLTEMMSFPYLLLSEKEMRSRMEKEMKELGFDKGKRKTHIDKMCEYRKSLYELIEQKKERFIESYERQQAEIRAKSGDEDVQMLRDELAGQSMDILGESEQEMN